MSFSLKCARVVDLQRSEYHEGGASGTQPIGKPRVFWVKGESPESVDICTIPNITPGPHNLKRP